MITFVMPMEPAGSLWRIFAGETRSLNTPALPAESRRFDRLGVMSWCDLFRTDQRSPKASLTPSHQRAMGPGVNPIMVLSDNDKED